MTHTFLEKNILNHNGRTVPASTYFKPYNKSTMSSSSTFPSIKNYFMERKKNRENTDKLATVKAAAWAWYQRGSGSEGRPMREYDLTRIHRAPKPTRYKLEAIRTNEEVMEGSNSSSIGQNLSPSHSENSLLDTYEIERISKQLDYYIESSRFVGGGVGDRDHRRVVLSESDTNGMMRRKSESKSKNKNKKAAPKGFWSRHRVVCGSKDDVVETRGVFGGRRLPEKGVVVVNRRPRATHA